MSKMFDVYNDDCISGALKNINSESIDLGIDDPPFGIGEVSFGKHYSRNGNNIIKGYKEAPTDYLNFSNEWLEQRYRTLKPNGTEAIVIGHTNLKDVLIAAENCGFHLINHVIWKYNFGVYTKNKFVTSHYHILIYSKSPNAKITFNRFCRYGSQDKDKDGGSLQYQDMEDVWFIKKENSPGELKNSNKLPASLIEKIIMYLSDENMTVSDFFLGNFTTAKVALGLGRKFVGFEINKKAYNHHIESLGQISFGEELTKITTATDDTPLNQGKPISLEERQYIYDKYVLMSGDGLTKKEIVKTLCKELERGKFSVLNIIETSKPKRTVEMSNEIFKKMRP